MGELDVILTEESLSSVPVLRVSGELDHLAGPQLLAKAEERLGDGCLVLLLDFTDCSYIDSGGIGSLFILLREMADEGFVGLVGANANVTRLLDIVGLLGHSRLRMFASRAEAASAIALAQA